MVRKPDSDGANGEAIDMIDQQERFIEHFGGYTGASASSTANARYQHEAGYGSNAEPSDHDWAPFQSKMDWDVACWTKM